MNGLLFFVAFDGVTGPEIWKSDGSETGTVLVRDVNPDAGGGIPHGLTVIGSTLFFSQPQGTQVELFKTDGSAEGTVMVNDLNGSSPSYPDRLVNVGGTLFFMANESATGDELWKSDGTADGTQLVKESSLAQQAPHRDCSPTATERLFSLRRPRKADWSTSGRATAPKQERAN